MSHYLLRRSGQGLLVLWAAFTLSFVLLQVLPGDAVLIKFQNPDLGLSPEQIAEMRLAYGADSPLWRQYFHTLMAMLRGDFGYSLQAGLPVSALIASNLPETLSLALPALLWRWRWPSPSPSPHGCRACAGSATRCNPCRRCLSRCRRSGSASP